MSEVRNTPISEGNPVEIDQRALVCKVLARYPGEFALFRELLQNADDAQSSNVEIHFKTAISREADNGSLVPHNVIQWTFKNNGNVFTKEDRTRLTKIAMGNPDPSKVGAFGVGFYSLFSVTDRPVVSSDGCAMEFYWKNEMLYVRQSPQTPSPWTIIVIPLREPSPMPEAIDLMRFLAASITFMVHLGGVAVFLDENCIGRIEKTTGLAEIIDFPIAFNHSKAMVVDRLQRHRFTIKAEASPSIDEPSSTEVPSFRGQSPASQSPPPQLGTTSGDPTGLCTAKAELGLTVFSADVDVKVNEKLSKELIRCTGKEPPPRLTYSLVYAGKDDYDRSLAQEHQHLMPIFQGLRADLNGALHPRVFIGHSTSQTTGIGGHMASSFIPTVERESIDLVDRNVAIWNRELLYVGGLLSRTVYELELSDIETSWSGKESAESRYALRKRFIHVLRFFTFHDSTPSPTVALELQRAFYACSTSPLRLLSSVGVHYASDIRSFDLLCDKFLKHVPMLSPDVTDVGEGIIKALPDEHKIRTITLSDVLQDLRGHTLDEGELVAYLQWQIRQRFAGMPELLQATCFWAADGTSVKLSSIQYFINSSGPGAHILSDGPLPASLMPPEITKHFAPTSLASFGWQGFTIADWLRYISQPEIRSANRRYDFVRSTDWAESVLRSVSSAWSTSEELRHLAKSVFANEKCIPTTHGLCRPEDSYHPNPAFDGLSLPVVRFDSGVGITTELKQFLIALGVQQCLPPRLLFKQMIETGKWKTSDLINYLVQVADTLSPGDISELKLYDAFAKDGVQTGTLFRADELYPPIDSFRQLHLPLIEWRERSEWEDAAPAAELLYRLGLRRFPSLEEIMSLCSQNTPVGTSAFDYLCTNLQTVYPGYNSDKFRDTPFVRAKNTGGSHLETPGKVFLDNQWKTLGFSVIQHRNRERVLEELGVQRHPPSSMLLQKLEKEPPSNEEIARQWFDILSNYSAFKQDELDSLSRLPIVPKTICGVRKWLTPAQCYLGKSTNLKHDLYSKLFHFVNFGGGAIQFLRACGAKNEPSEEDVAANLVDNPERFYELAKPERFLQELRDLAARSTRISSDIISKMMSKPVLLGMRHNNSDARKNTYSLWKPTEIVIVDDIHTYRLFGDLITAAPRDMHPELEEFYVLLGCRHLTKVVRERCPQAESAQSGENEDAMICSEFRALVPERLRLFLHHNPRPVILAPPFCSNNIRVTVRVREYLSVSKTFAVGNKETVKERDAWAFAKCEQGTLQLWLSSSAKRDILAVSLCRALLGTVNLSDALLLMTILSEDLDVLQGRGYDVNPCSSIAPETSSSPLTYLTTQHPLTESVLDPNAGAGAQPASGHPHLLGGSEAAPGSLSSSSGVSLMVTKTANNICGAIHKVRSNIAPRSMASSAEPSGTATLIRPLSPCRVMSLEHIQSTVANACKSRQDMLLRLGSDADMSTFLKDGYCDISKPDLDLQLLGQIKNVEVHASQGTLSVDTFMERKRERLIHFAGIITPIAKIYDLPKGSLRIFYDITSGCIAFNRKGTLYLNLRYFEVWHYQDVKNGNLRRALSSWFLTVAHEIAHNLVARHDSEHEFWFSAICEAHVDAFMRLLGPPPPSV
ncbi:hypothetical protein HD554DRAFT_273220 [Boletus coccyginus]|nr:hypothetical protein HD554DRAFT_273220 [Boletus coccyginus]